MVASGLPEECANHAENLCYLALDMREASHSMFYSPSGKVTARSLLLLAKEISLTLTLFGTRRHPTGGEEARDGAHGHSHGRRDRRCHRHEAAALSPLVRLRFAFASRFAVSVQLRCCFATRGSQRCSVRKLAKLAVLASHASLTRFLRSGDTVNTASRMESTCFPDRIQMSVMTYERILNGPKPGTFPDDNTPVRPELAALVLHSLVCA